MPELKFCRNNFTAYVLNLNIVTKKSGNNVDNKVKYKIKYETSKQ